MVDEIYSVENGLKSYVAVLHLFGLHKKVHLYSKTVPSDHREV